MIIKSLLDQDLYKFTMQMLILHQFPSSEAEFTFKCRNEGVDLRPIRKKLEEEITHLCSLRFTQDELYYLRSIPFLKKDYINYLEDFRLKERYLYISEEDGQLAIKAKGEWLNIMMYEIFVLSIVNELYFKPENEEEEIKVIEEGVNRLHDKLDLLHKENNYGTHISIAEFGTRRRYSREWQDLLIETLVEEGCENLAGTSNVYQAKKHKLTPIGTQAHEYFCAMQAMDGVRLEESQKYAMECWAKEYRGSLGIALTDTINMDAFLNDMDLYFAKLYDGCRHDSGCPFIWGDKLISHYNKLGIDPETKTAVFSDGLTVKKALEIAKYFSMKIKTSFGIGTSITNDMGLEPLNIVMKMTSCNGKPVAKISDSPGKNMCKDEEYLKYLKKVFNIK